MELKEERLVKIRSMNANDIPASARIGTEVGWPRHARRFEFFVRHPFCEALVAESGGEVAGVGFGTRNGAAGWLGLICVSPEYQGKGMGGALTSRVSELLQRRGCRTLVLTATEMGRPIYEKLDFSVETFYRGYAGPGIKSSPLHPGLRRMTPEDLPAVCELDLRCTGEDRSHLLRATGGSGWMMAGEGGSVSGYHAPAPWGDGPVIASDAETGRALVHLVRTLAGSGGTAKFWLTDESEEGREHMREIGFQEKRRLPRMVRGAQISWRPESLWGLFSLAKG